jgi:hypothetical protein
MTDIRNSVQPTTGRFSLPIWALSLPLLGLAVACDTPTATVDSTGAKGKTTKQGTIAKENTPFVPPAVTATISRVRLNWKDGLQSFDLNLTNASDKMEIVHALVYARNDNLVIPRRGISPPTAFGWFEAANIKDGRLSAEEVERIWKQTGFSSARGGKLRTTWDEKVNPESTKTIECFHDLEEKSKHPQWLDKKLERTGYTDYDLWLFTPEGRCYFQEKWKVTLTNPPTVAKVEAPPEPKKAPEPAPVDTKPKETRPANPQAEAQAASELKLALYYLERNRIQDAKDKLQSIIQKYPGTKAAAEAEERLKKLA